MKANATKRAERAPKKKAKRAAAPAREVLERLTRAMPAPRCELDHENAWQLLIATILSAQSTDARVNMTTPALFARFPTAAALEANDQEYTYGRLGTPTIKALAEAIAELEGGHATLLTPSGLSAIATTFLALASAGDHVLVSDSVYRPTRRFCDSVLKRLGVETTYYDPLVGAGIKDLIRPDTKVVFTESPGS